MGVDAIPAKLFKSSFESYRAANPGGLCLDFSASKIVYISEGNARLAGMKRWFFLLLALVPMFGTVSCSSQVKARKPVSYRFVHGRTALLKQGKSYAPKNAPEAVKRAIAAGNRLQGMPYVWGGGHGRTRGGFDCSGTVSYVLREAGLLRGSLTSSGFLRYGRKGEGRWITIYMRHGHVFMTVAGLRLDTGGRGGSTGPRWKPETRQSHGYYMRHPAGL
jgi:hypothetical protein